jgi:hypothetical protein
MLAVRQADAVQLAAREDAEQVRDRIVAEARSNPLALLELPRRLRPAELAADSGLPPHRRWRAALKTAFTAVESASARHATAAVYRSCRTGCDVRLVAARGQAAADRRERGGSSRSRKIDRPRRRVRFRQPLVGSAVY